MRERVRGIEVITGSMFCGKSEEIIRRAGRLQIAHVPHQAFNHVINTRDGATISSRNGTSIPAELIERSVEIPKLLKPDTAAVLVDEVNFFDDEIYDVARWLSESRKIRVILGGLKDDYRGEPFGAMGELLTSARDIQVLHAICQVCTDHANHTQRLVNGKPDSYFGQTVIVQEKEKEGLPLPTVTYEARCEGCWEMPDSPYKGVLYQSPK